MSILIDTSKIAYFSRYFWTILKKFIRFYIRVKFCAMNSRNLKIFCSYIKLAERKQLI